MMGIAASDKKMQWMGIDIFRSEGGKSAEEWVGGDMLGLMQQLGVVPIPPEVSHESRQSHRNS